MRKPTAAAPSPITTIFSPFFRQSPTRVTEALAYGLAFISLAAEHFDLVVPARRAGSREVQGLLKVLSSAWLLDQLASLPGYDPARCGERIATLPQRR